jgi:ParB family chromosome partitioning protein
MNKEIFLILPINKLKISPFNIRQVTTTEIKEEMEELKQSIKSKGIIEPLIVRKTNNDYEIVVGQRRFIAGKEIGLKEFPCIVKELSDQEALEYSLIENLQRKDVDHLDIAKALKKLYDIVCHGDTKLSLRKFAKQQSNKIGLEWREILRYLSLLNLTPEVQEMVSEDKLGVKLASQLATIEKEKQEKVANLLTQTSTEDQAEELIRKVKEGKEPEEALEEVQPTREMRVVIIFKKEKVEFKLPSRYWRILSDLNVRTKKPISEIIAEALDNFFKGLGYGKNK